MPNLAAMVRSLRARLLAAVVGLAGVLTFAVPLAAEAHSLDSSTIAVTVTDTSATATVTVALETLDQALSTDYAASADLSGSADAITAYVGST